MQNRTQLNRSGTGLTSPVLSLDQCRILIDETEALIKGFDDKVLSVDTYAMDALELDSLDKEIKDPYKLFKKQALYGVSRFRGMLKVLISSFYFCNSAKALREDATKYTLFGYLIFMRVDELGWHNLEQFILSQGAVKMHVLLDYCYNFEMLGKWVEEQWSKVYDESYVQDVLFKAIRDYMEPAKRLIARLAKVAFGSSDTGSDDAADQTSKPRKKMYTIVKPFDLHKPKRPVLADPIRIDMRVPVKEVPASVYSNSLQSINSKNQERREKQRLQTEKQYQADLAPNLSENKFNLEAHRSAKQRREDAELAYKFKAKPAPKFSTKAIVRTTAATILKQNALIDAKQAKEAAVLKAYESELRDASEFFKWQENNRKQDEADRLEAVDQVREGVKISHRRAKEAMEKSETDNMDAAKQQRQTLHELRQQLAEEKSAALKHRQEQAEVVKAVHFEAPKKALQQHRRENMERAELLNKQKAAERRRKEEEDRLEQEIRNDLIRQIRAIERAPKNAFFIREFDPTETGGHGLDCEMSLVELRERLKMNKQIAADEEAHKREEMRLEKVEKQERLSAALSRANRIREMAEEQNKQRKIQAQMTKKQLRKMREEEGADTNRKLVSKLRARRAKRQAEVEADGVRNAAISKARMLLGADKDAMERRHMEEQLLGAEREARDRQTRAKSQVAAYERIKDRHNKQTATFKKKNRKEAAARDAKRSDQVDKAMSYITEKQFATKRQKQEKFRSHRDHVKKTVAAKHVKAYKPKQYKTASHPETM